MDIKLHKQATTTPKIRAEIQAAPASLTDSELARQYGVSPATIRRWRYRDDVHDRPHTRHNLLATLTSEQEEVLIAAREFLRLGLDDLLVVAREFLNPRLSRSGLHRMLQRREVPTLAELARQDAGDDGKPRHKPFKDYEPGYVHIDIKHLPQMPDEEQKRYLYVAIDRATRWVYLEVRRSQSAKDAKAFMKRVEEKAPFTIQTVLTDNGLPAVAVASWTKRSLLMSA
ncbi:MAG: DDE-type integrase/transposase/recombinase [Billgrantia sp.]